MISNSVLISLIHNNQIIKSPNKKMNVFRNKADSVISKLKSSYFHEVSRNFLTYLFKWTKISKAKSVILVD